LQALLKHTALNLSGMLGRAATKYDKFELLKMVDVLVDGRYIHELRDRTLAFRGSSNQRIIDVQESLRINMIVEWKNPQTLSL